MLLCDFLTVTRGGARRERGCEIFLLTGMGRNKAPRHGFEPGTGVEQIIRERERERDRRNKLECQPSFLQISWSLPQHLILRFLSD